MRGKLGLIPAFGDSIGSQVNKAELGLCAKYAGEAEKSHAAILSVLYAALPFVEDSLNCPTFKSGYVASRIKEIRAAIALAESQT